MQTISVIPENFEPPQDNFPFPAPFILSSVEKDWCRWQKDKDAAIAFIKRRHLEENLNVIAGELGMDAGEQARFISHWGSPSRSDKATIRAELDECFDLRQKAESWMERATPARAQGKSRLEKYAESAQQFYNNNVNTETIPTSPSGTQGFGYADIPDEQ